MEFHDTQKQSDISAISSAVSSRLFTIGHSNHSWERFGELLRAAGVTAVIDVRSSPFSRWLPQFNRPELESSLRPLGIAYRFQGDALGGRPKSPDVYTPEGQVDYERVRKTAAFQRRIDQLLRELGQGVPVLLCAEEDPLDCHRALMIAPALIEQGVRPIHLRGDGSRETTEEFERRLLAETGIGAGIVDGLFAATLSAAEHRELLAEAYRTQARRKAFRLAAEAAGGEDRDGIE
jgi:hypothetical protein